VRQNALGTIEEGRKRNSYARRMRWGQPTRKKGRRMRAVKLVGGDGNERFGKETGSFFIFEGEQKGAVKRWLFQVITA